MASRVKNNIPKRLTAWWKGQEQAYAIRVMTTAENVANRIREGYSGVGRQGSDSKGWKEGHAPVDTGALAQSVRTEPDGNFAANILIGKDYGAYVEFGTKVVGPKPYVRNALRIEAKGFKTGILMQGELI